MIALIPARAGSKRIPGKNTKPLGGVPLLAWTIQAAKESDVFDEIHVSSDDEEALNIACDLGVRFIVRPRALATDTAPDLLWIQHLLSPRWGRPTCFAILRPTSPFRTAATIRRAFAQWKGESDCIDSLRAVRLVTETPYKMWTQSGHGMPIDPLLPGLHHPDGTPYHSSPTQTLPPVYVQTGALEMGWTRNVECLNSISGRKVSPFFCHGPEALDLNTPDDWERAERLIASGAVEPPPVSLAGLSPSAATV